MSMNADMITGLALPFVSAFAVAFGVLTGVVWYVRNEQPRKTSGASLPKPKPSEPLIVRKKAPTEKKTEPETPHTLCRLFAQHLEEGRPVAVFRCAMKAGDVDPAADERVRAMPHVACAERMTDGALGVLALTHAQPEVEHVGQRLTELASAVGAARAPEQGETFDAAWHAATTAMRAAQAPGAPRFLVYDEWTMRRGEPSSVY